MPKPRTPTPPPAPTEEDEDPVLGNLFNDIGRPAPETEPPAAPPKRKAPTKPRKLAVKIKE